MLVMYVGKLMFVADVFSAHTGNSIVDVETLQLDLVLDACGFSLLTMRPHFIGGMYQKFCGKSFHYQYFFVKTSEGTDRSEMP